MSPLLPIKKDNGDLRFVNDYRCINAHFSKAGIEQIDVERTLRSLDDQWKYYMKVDLKDAFFSVPIDDNLQRRFTFQWGTERYAWTRLPQGWCWSSIFFHETVATILRGTKGSQLCR